MNDTLSIREGLLVLLVESRPLDATNVLALMRNGEAAIRAYVGPGIDLDLQRSVETVDDLLIGASRNGAVDLFA